MNRTTQLFDAFARRRLTITFDKVGFTHTRLTWKRIQNWFLAEFSYLLKCSGVWAYPTHLQIEPSNMCNLRCPLCHVVTDNKPKGLLKIDDFKKIIDEIGDYLLFLHFWGWGEPFLNKDVFSMIRYAKDKGIQIISSTNGHFFDDLDNIDGLINSGLDVLIFAIDGINAETYEKYRHKGDFERALRGLRFLVGRRKERGMDQPRVNLRMLVTKDNESQISEMKNLGKELGVDIFSLKTMYSFDNPCEGESLIPSNREYRRFQYDEMGKPIRIKNPCKKPWNHPTIYRDGTVVPCDYYTGEEFSLGNVFGSGRKGFRAVWFGERFQEFRKRFISHNRVGLRCDDCALNYADVDRCVSHAYDFQCNVEV